MKMRQRRRRYHQAVKPWVRFQRHLSDFNLWTVKATRGLRKLSLSIDMEAVNRLTQNLENK